MTNNAAKRRQQQHLFRAVCCNGMPFHWPISISLFVFVLLPNKMKIVRSSYYFLGWSFQNCFSRKNKCENESNKCLQSNKTIGFYQCNFQSKRLNKMDEYCRLLTYQLFSWAKLWLTERMSLFYNSLWTEKSVLNGFALSLSGKTNKPIDSYHQIPINQWVLLCFGIASWKWWLKLQSPVDMINRIMCGWCACKHSIWYAYLSSNDTRNSCGNLVND